MPQDNVSRKIFFKENYQGIITENQGKSYSSCETNIMSQDNS